MQLRASLFYELLVFIYDFAFLAAEEFMFRRSNSRDSSLSAYMAGRFASVEEEDEESEEEPLPVSQDYRRPQLDPISEGVCINFIYFFINVLHVL